MEGEEAGVVVVAWHRPLASSLLFSIPVVVFHSLWLALLLLASFFPFFFFFFFFFFFLFCVVLGHWVESASRIFLGRSLDSFTLPSTQAFSLSSLTQLKAPEAWPSPVGLSLGLLSVAVGQCVVLTWFYLRREVCLCVKRGRGRSEQWRKGKGMGVRISPLDLLACPQPTKGGVFVCACTSNFFFGCCCCLADRCFR